MEDFIHLHVHTQYSILDGQASISKLIDKAVSDHMRGFAITDHGNMMGIKEFFDSSVSLNKKGKAAVKEAEEALAALDTGTYAKSKDEAALSDEDIRHKWEKKLEVGRVKRDFKPIFGCEMYCARHSMDSRQGKEDQGGWHLIVLAKNQKGYHNLVKLVSRAWTDGFYMRPRTDHADLERYHEGLIVCSACIAGEVPSKILKGDLAGAEESLLWFKKVFGDDYYLELQRHKVTDPEQRANRETYPLQQTANAELIKLARKHDVKLICTNDAHFVDEENAEAHDRLICLSTGKDLDDATRMLYSKQEWFKTRAEMNSIFSDVPEALSNTLEILDKVETYSINHGPIMPNFDIPTDFGTEEEYRQRLTEEDLYNEFTQDENGNVVMSREDGMAKISKLGGFDKLYRIKLEADYLGKLAYEGAVRRYGDPIPENVRELVKFELHIMKTMGFPGYFLIVQDYINVARNELDVSVGPGRGSAAGSVVAYCLGITQIDPIKYDLLFERFLNPDRISLPDIDVDFDDDGRGKVLQWVTNKYGEENVAHIITYGTMATKLAIKDVARVEKLPLAESNRLCKLIPDKLPEGPDGKSPKLNLANCIAAIPELQEAENSRDPLMRDTIRYAKMLEGNVRNTGVHACGFIICRDKISDWVPVSVAEDKNTGERLHCTQYEGKVIEDTGLIKMDFLGLKTLSILREAVAVIKESTGIEVDVDNIDIDDPATYQLYCDGRTIGTFQFESPGMQKYLRELQPSTFEDLIAMNALYRPGPMQYIPQFIARKQGKEEITYDLDCMEEYLKDTYGITVYQEQVMLLSRKIADFTRGESDNLRKAMGKKLIEKLNHMYPKFIAGGKKNGHDEKKLEKIWNDWRAFASYAFNKSHATCYSWVAYQTAYLKAHFPAQYMAAVMSRNKDNPSEISKLMDECKLMGINTLIPDVNESRLKFSVNNRGDIRFGLGAVKGVGAGAANSIVEEREKDGPYRNVYDFFERINLSHCNRKVVESLILAGALDCFDNVAREQYFVKTDSGDMLDTLMKYANQLQQDKFNMSASLFDGFDSVEITKPAIPVKFTPWTDIERLNKERELIGIFISGHPLDRYSLVLNYMCNTSMNSLVRDKYESLSGKTLTMGGIVTNVRQGIGKNGKPFGIVRIEDYQGMGEIPLFGEDWARWMGFMHEGAELYITGSTAPRRYRETEYDLNLNKIEFLSDVLQHISRVLITIYLDQVTDDVINDFSELLSEMPEGPSQVYIDLCDFGENKHIHLKSAGHPIMPNKALVDFVKEHQGMVFSIPENAN